MRNLAPRDSDTASFLTPAVKKKRKLYSTTPQTNAVSSSNAEKKVRIFSLSWKEYKESEHVFISRIFSGFCTSLGGLNLEVALFDTALFKKMNILFE